MAANEFRVLRERAGLSREVVAAALACSVADVAAWETGRRTIPLEIAESMRYLGREGVTNQ